MDCDDEQLLRRRVYGADHDHPCPRPDRRYAELIGGPLDGLMLDITGWKQTEVETVVALPTDGAVWRRRPGDARSAPR